MGKQEDNESFTKSRKDNQNDSYRKGESPHSRDYAGKGKKGTAGSKDNNTIGGINIGNYGPGLSGLKMQNNAKGNQISSNFNEISAGFRMMTQ